MTYAATRSAIVTLFNAPFIAAFPAVPVYYENTVEINLDAAPALVVLASVDFMDAIQMEIAPLHTDTYGEFVLRIHSRASGGFASSLGIADWMHANMSYKITSGVNLNAAYIAKKSTVAGWLLTDVVVPFRYIS